MKYRVYGYLASLDKWLDIYCNDIEQATTHLRAIGCTGIGIHRLTEEM